MLMELARELMTITTVLESAPERSRYMVDGQVPLLVTIPASEEQVAACLQIAAQRGAVVAPRGAGTKGNLGNLLKQLDLVLSLEKLNQVIEYVPADLTITVQAGMRFADMQALVAQHGQTVALDPSRAANATIGGIVAAASSGPQRLAYGSVRDVLLGTRVAMTDGKVIKTGGRVVKNVAGYDMNKLLVGSLGTLGVMTEITLKLRPIPAVTRTRRFGFQDTASGLASAEVILNSELLPAAVALLTKGVANRLDAPGPVTLAVLLAETGPNVAYQAERLHELLAGKAIAHDDLEGSAQEAFWESIRNYGDQSGATLQVKVNTIIADIENQLGFATQWPGLPCDGIVYVGSGTVMLHGFDPGADPAFIAKVATALLVHASEAGGSAVVESVPVEAKPFLDVWGPKRPEWQILEGIKRTFDPAGVLNRGRYVGGI